MKLGDRVEVNHPRYQGLEGEVVHIHGNWVKVDIGMGRPREFEAGCLRLLPSLSLQNSAYPSSYSSSYSDDSKIDSRPYPEAVTVANYAEKQAQKRTSKTWMHCRIYRSHGGRYYRFVWGDSKTRGWQHIPGGNWLSPLVKDRRDQVRRMISEGRSHGEIKSAIANWGW